MTDETKTVQELIAEIDLDVFTETFAELYRLSASVWANYGFVTSGTPNAAYSFDLIDEDGNAVWEDTDRYGDTNQTRIPITAFPQYLKADLNAEREAYAAAKKEREAEALRKKKEAERLHKERVAEQQRREELRIYNKVKRELEKEGKT